MPIARTDVTSHINKYIKEHDLQNKEYKREILPNEALRKIFSEPLEISKRENADPNQKVYSYLQIQRYISHHFPKKTIKTEI